MACETSVRRAKALPNQASGRRGETAPPLGSVGLPIRGEIIFFGITVLPEHTSRLQPQVHLTRVRTVAKLVCGAAFVVRARGDRNVPRGGVRSQDAQHLATRDIQLTHAPYRFLA